ncbi:hypothetical protein PACTADRAFT_51684 [Pachysolen tannophilus NRRL Y-2460]|uniref:Uncharacterized protein n=1 Tax=Pachysolen tannophilus NRRL Y-2460 TaxID=669874 RepID=A0A1E4TQI8_PACTA|nr:hypothetical protein PACTADRAFT_51684 [Pachysolen tannophilus NRRL Y-2460]
MDMDEEVQNFEKTCTPSLIGSSIRGEPPLIHSGAVSTSRPSSRLSMGKNQAYDYSTESIEDLQRQGVLLKDEENEGLDQILDNAGHVKSEALDIKEKEKTNQDEVIAPPSDIDIKTINDHEESTISAINEDDQNFIAPASSRDGSKSRSASVKPKPGSHHNSHGNSSVALPPVRSSPLSDSTANIIDDAIEQDDDESIQDVVNSYNEGRQQKDDEDDEIEISQESEQEQQKKSPVDDENQLESENSNQDVEPPTSSSNVTSPSRPHLARGDSCHNTVTNNNFSTTPPLNIGERKSRQPYRSTNLSESSINYLRSISRSRSRVANDNAALGINQGADEAELKEEGALTGGSNYDQMPDLEDAVDKALKLVEDELNGLRGHVTESKGNRAESIQEETFEELENDQIKKKDETLDDLNKDETETEIVPDEVGKQQEVETKNSDGEEKHEEENSAEEQSSVEKETKEEQSEQQDEDELETPEEEPEVEAEREVEPEVEAKVEAEPETQPKSQSVDGSVFVPKAPSKLTYEDEPVYLYTSLAGGFQIATRTNRLITILKANKVEFTMRDLGTDEEAKKIWKRYSRGKTLPGIVRGKDDYIGNWEDIEESNEMYQVRSLIFETA